MEPNISIFKRKIVINFLSISLNMCFGYSKEPSVGSGGGGGTLIYKIYVGLGFKILNLDIFVGVNKNEYFSGIKIL